MPISINDNSELNISEEIRSLLSLRHGALDDIIGHLKGLIESLIKGAIDLGIISESATLNEDGPASAVTGATSGEGSQNVVIVEGEVVV